MYGVCIYARPSYKYISSKCINISVTIVWLIFFYLTLNTNEVKAGVATAGTLVSCQALQSKGVHFMAFAPEFRYDGLLLLILFTF